MLGYKFSFETYVKNVREKATKCSLKTTSRFYSMLMDIDLPKFDIYQGTVAPYCLKSHTNFCCCAYFQKKVLSMSGLKLTLSFVTSFLLDICLELIKTYIQACSHYKVHLTICFCYLNNLLSIGTPF